MVALTIAYFTFRKQKGSTIGATVTPLFNRSKILLSENSRYFSCFSHSIWYCAICWDWCSTNCWGLSYLFPSIHNTLLTQLVLIAIFAVLYLTSAQTGLDRGIKYLSNLNFSLAGILLVSFLLLGPTVFIMKYFTSTLGSYIGALPSMGLNLEHLMKNLLLG